MENVKSFLTRIRKPDKSVPRHIQIFVSIGIAMAGFALGVLQKWIEIEVEKYDKRILLLPVAFVLFFTRWALETSVKLTEWAVGLLTLIVGAAIIYSIVIHRWGDLFLYSLIFAGIMAILMAVVVVRDFCDSMLDKISML